MSPEEAAGNLLPFPNLKEHAEDAKADGQRLRPALAQAMMRGGWIVDVAPLPDIFHPYTSEMVQHEAEAILRQEGFAIAPAPWWPCPRLFLNVWAREKGGCVASAVVAGVVMAFECINEGQREMLGAWPWMCFHFDIEEASAGIEPAKAGLVYVMTHFIDGLHEAARELNPPERGSPAEGESAPEGSTPDAEP